MEISVELVKDLRQRTGAGVIDCKTALQEAKGNLEAAIDYLRRKGLATAAKKAGRIATDGDTSIARLDASIAVIRLKEQLPGQPRLFSAPGWSVRFTPLPIPRFILR